MSILQYEVGQTVLRKDNGRRVRIVEVKTAPVTKVFYVTEDCKDGHTCIMEHSDLLPDHTSVGGYRS